MVARDWIVQKLTKKQIFSAKHDATARGEPVTGDMPKGISSGNGHKENNMVQPTGIEPVTSSFAGMRSSS